MWGQRVPHWRARAAWETCQAAGRVGVQAKDCSEVLIRPSASWPLAATLGEGHLDLCNMRPAHVRMKAPRAAEAQGQGHGCLLPQADAASPSAPPAFARCPQTTGMVLSQLPEFLSHLH